MTCVEDKDGAVKHTWTTPTLATLKVEGTASGSGSQPEGGSSSVNKNFS